MKGSNAAHKMKVKCITLIKAEQNSKGHYALHTPFSLFMSVLQLVAVSAIGKSNCSTALLPSDTTDVTTGRNPTEG